MINVNGHSPASRPRRPSPRDAGALADQRDLLCDQLLAERAAHADEIRRLAAELERLTNSRGFRALQAFRAAKSSWKGLLGLPTRLLHEIRVESPMESSSSPREGGSPPTAPQRIRAASHVTSPSLRVMAIVDDFTLVGLTGECELLLPVPGSGERELADFDADLLFVESAWHGNAGAWRGLFPGGGEPLLRLLHFCRSRRIPTVFWNKEDPSHFEYFLPLAREFDVVLTTDADCVARYQQRLNRSDVHVLPFACQPQIHHPLQNGPRDDAVCFAGSYYRQYPERMRDFDTIVGAVSPLRRIDIFDRNHDSGLDEFHFPERYASMVLGGLDVGQVPVAYRGYRYAINLNTIKDSPTMLARRTFELLACGTVVLSNHSQAVQRLFGDLVLAAPNASELEGRFRSLLENDVERRRIALLGLRKVLGEHAWEHRLRQVESLVFSGPIEPALMPEVLVVAPVRDAAELKAVLQAFDAQTYRRRRLTLVLSGGGAPSLQRSDVAVVHAGAAVPIDRGVAVAGFWPDDHYGPNYLLDMMHAAKYANAVAVGKHSYYSDAGDGSCVLVEPHTQYQRVSKLGFRRSILLCAEVFPDSIASLARLLIENAALGEGTLVSVDEFNYCSGRPVGFDVVSDDGSQRINQGMSLSEFLGQVGTAESDNFAATLHSDHAHGQEQA